MRPLHFFSIVILLAILTFCGCKPLYVPNVINTPLFSNKGEVQVAVHFGTAGIDPQLAFAVTDNVGIMFNGSFQQGYESTDPTEEYTNKHSFGELGIGYYTKLTERQRFEVYSGYGIGNIKFEDYDINNIPFEAKINTNRFFIQPAYGITSKSFDFSVASRFIWITGKSDTENYTYSFWEPAATIRAGGPFVKGVMQLGVSVPFQRSEIIDYEPFLFSIGVQAHFNRIFE